MKTLAQIKNETATKHGYLSLVKLITSGHTTNTLKVIDEMLILVQKECLKNASYIAKIDIYDCDSFGHRYHKLTTGGLLDKGTLYEVNKDSITNENNIIK